MDLEAAFDDMQATVNADPDAVREARERRNAFRDAFNPEDDVDDVIFTGSIARSSQIEPINDVDLVVIYDNAEHPGWGESGASAEEALEETRKRVVGFFGNGGTVDPDFVRLARASNHAVKCFLDDPDDPDAFTVDLVSALRIESGRLLITEKDSACWIESDPEYLNAEVAKRQEQWPEFVPLIRVLKRWNRDHGDTMLPLFVEVMAIEHLPAAGRPRALQSFFAAARVAVSPDITDPADISPIQPDLDVEAARTRLEAAADASWRAVAAADRGDTDRAACYWREVFGAIFHEPPGGCRDLRAETAAAIATAVPRERRPARNNPQG